MQKKEIRIFSEQDANIRLHNDETDFRLGERREKATLVSMRMEDLKVQTNSA